MAESQRTTLRWALVLVILCLATAPAFACLWDKDTLAMEAKGMPETIDAIVGRFDRFPNLYYEMRLARVTKVIEQDRLNLEAYDDAGVACDRLGRGDEAIAWMEKKKDVLDRLDPNEERTKEHQYRYLANVGTFWVHHWFRKGADRSRIDDVKKARDLIAEAINLNPNAHFGREKYQLKILEWILEPPLLRGKARATSASAPATQSESSDKSLPDDGSIWDNQAFGYAYPDCIGLYRAADKYVETHGQDEADVLRLDSATREMPRLKALGYEDAERGLVGLIVLGNAWESVDVYYALTLVLQAQGKSSVASLSLERVRELVKSGRGSAIPGAPTGDALAQAMGSNAGTRAEHPPTQFYEQARQAAQARNEAWLQYLVSRLNAGRHPDTDPGFWNEWHEPARPAMPGVLNGFFSDLQAKLIAFGLVIAGVALAASVMLRRMKRQKPAVA